MEFFDLIAEIFLLQSNCCAKLLLKLLDRNIFLRLRCRSGDLDLVYLGLQAYHFKSYSIDFFIDFIDEIGSNLIRFTLMRLVVLSP